MGEAKSIRQHVSGKKPRRRRRRRPTEIYTEVQKYVNSLAVPDVPAKPFRPR